jgi:hypothetical protein
MDKMMQMVLDSRLPNIILNFYKKGFNKLAIWEIPLITPLSKTL